ncbi:MAG: Veg family protein [Bacilli bacterium]
MNINTIKDNIETMKGKNIEAKIYLGRNKYEYFEGVVDEIHPYLFTLKKADEIKSFSYADILTKNIVIKRLEK